jgi:hypothetical protein
MLTKNERLVMAINTVIVRAAAIMTFSGSATVQIPAIK